MRDLESKFSAAEIKKRAVRRGAQVLYELWEEGQKAHSRILELLILDELIFIGTSINGKGWREHVVPLAFIRDHCYELFDRGCTVEEAAAFIDAHMRVAYISKDERRKLDKDLKLGRRMPSDWQHGDVMARLALAGIVLDPTNPPESIDALESKEGI